MQEWVAEIGGVYRMLIDTKEELKKKIKKGYEKFPDDVEIKNLKVLVEEELQLSRNDEGEMNAEQEDGAKNFDSTTNLKVTDNSRPNKDSMENSLTWTQILDPVTCDKLEKSAFLEIDEGKRKFSLEKQVFEQENCVIRNIESELQLEDERYISPKTVVDGNMKTRAQIEKHAKLSNIIQKLTKIEKENQSIQEEKKDSKGKKVSRKRTVGNSLGTRISKPSSLNKSPYVKRPMSINKQLTVLETNVSENIFTSFRDEQ